MINTIWGYDITSVNALPALLSSTEFTELTAGRYTTDTRTSAMIAAAEAAVRNYVGWHLGTTVSCAYLLTATNAPIIHNGMDMIVQLPARYVTEVTRVLVDAVRSEGEWTGTECEFAIQRNGILTVYDVDYLDRKSKIYIEYSAGLPDNLMKDIKELIAYKVTQALSNSNGVQSESTGGVSVTYSASWANQRATSLPDECKAALNLYRLQGVF